MCMTGNKMQACVQKVEETAVSYVQIIYRPQYVSDAGITAAHSRYRV